METANRRKHARSRSQKITVHLNGETHTTHDWSPGGFSLGKAKIDCQVGDQLTGVIEIANFPDSEQFSVEITRMNSDHFLAAKFIEISAQGYINLCSLTNDNESAVIGN